MIPILEFQERSVNGPVMKSDEFDVALARKVRELVKKYGIRYTPEELVVDDATADAIFQAGMDLLADLGLYNLETQRVVTFQRAELEQMVREYNDNPPTLTVGRGKDEHTIKPRSMGDSSRPVLWVVAAGVIQQAWFVRYLLSCAREEIIQGFGIAGGIAAVDGVPAKTGAPSEILCGIWEAKAQHEALRQAGRPDMFLGLIPTVSSTGGTAAVLGPGLHEPHNSQIGIHIIPEQKIDWTRLNLAALCQERNIQPWTSVMSLLGGLCGNAAGVAVGAIANCLGQIAMGHGKTVSFYLNDMTARATSRAGLWGYTACFRAMDRNFHISTGTCCADSGPAFSLEEQIVRGCSMAVALTTCGGAYNWGAGSDGMVARIEDAVMTGVAGMGREQANELLIRIAGALERMEQAGGTPLPGEDSLFPAKYDLETLKPRSHYQDAGRRAVDILVECGVPLSDRLSLDC